MVVECELFVCPFRWTFPSSASTPAVTQHLRKSISAIRQDNQSLSLLSVHDRLRLLLLRLLDLLLLRVLNSILGSGVGSLSYWPDENRLEVLWREIESESRGKKARQKQKLSLSTTRRGTQNEEGWNSQREQPKIHRTRHPIK